MDKLNIFIKIKFIIYHKKYYEILGYTCRNFDFFNIIVMNIN